MFDFQKLEVYKKAKSFHIVCRDLINQNRIDAYTKNQFGRASLSIALNIAEGAGKFSKADRRNFYITARESIFECVAIIDILHDNRIISDIEFNLYLNKADEISRILFTMIKALSQ